MDYIIHVVDASNPQAEMQRDAHKNSERNVLVKKRSFFNKQDKAAGESLRDLRADHTLKISARTGEGLGEFKERFQGFCRGTDLYGAAFSVFRSWSDPADPGYGQLLSEEYTEGGIAVKARVPREIYPKVT